MTALTTIEIKSHKGPYTVKFSDAPFENLSDLNLETCHLIMDAKVVDLYKGALSSVEKAKSKILIDATEQNKSIEKFDTYISHLVSHKVRRGDTLVAIGGGIIQDITCFLAATMLRGLDWVFFPTTLLAQADSCIGSKSSINAGQAKNILGTYTPPKQIFVCTEVLNTLTPQDYRSGIGEMLKVHVIDGPESMDMISKDYESIIDKSKLEVYIHRSLNIKKKLIESDEFDMGIRRVLNYGHSFGHAIEAATDFKVPHGIAVTMGMDMANFISKSLGRMDESHYRRMKPVLRKNYAGFESVAVPREQFFDALSKDKKNTNTGVGVILPDANAIPQLVTLPMDVGFKGLCDSFFKQEV